jgi:hypothetical protein
MRWKLRRSRRHSPAIAEAGFSMASATLRVKPAAAAPSHKPLSSTALWDDRS